MSEFLTISNTNEMLRLVAGNIVYVASDGNYSDIFTCDGEKHTVTLQLGMVEDIMSQQFEKENNFVRIGKSLIVNLLYVSYINPARKKIVLSNNSTFKFSLEASSDALKKLKDYFDTKLKKK